MRKNIFIAVASLLFFVQSSFAQNVGIGTNNPQNKLHVAGGFRLDTLVGVNGNGILTHNSLGTVYGLKFTGNVNDVLRGDGTFGAGSSGGGSNAAVWMLNGNSGTNPGTDFIGTTDDKSLVFKIRNITSGQVDSSVRNTSLGYRSLALNSGFSNTAIGFQTLFSNTFGIYNTANGSLALYSNTTGNENTANGYQSLYWNTTGSGNTATGYTSLYANTTGYNNTANGYLALYHNTTGYNNTATGLNALNSNTTGHDNTANGQGALAFNLTGLFNTATGTEALLFNTTGGNNTANGFRALNSNTTGSFNTANGLQALYSNTTGIDNTANGTSALYSNTTGISNTAIGVYSLGGNSTGSFNVAIGHSSLSSTTGSRYNTTVGYNAGFSHNLGWNNTLIGANSQVSANDIFNSIALGESAVVNASNKIRLGNSSVTVIEGQVAYTFPSDGRFKTNITENIKGLDFIMKLRPVIYNFQTSKYDEFIKGETNKDVKFASSIDYSESEKIRHNGFIAQEVEKVAKETGYEFDGVVTPKNNKEAYGLSYSQFVVPLVKAVQEQQAIIEKQQKQIDELIKQLQLIKEKLK